MKAAKYLILFLIVIQFALPYAVPWSTLYTTRINYLGLFENNTNNYYPLLQQIKQEIDSRKLKDYVLVIGDSVLFSTPVAPKDSIGVHLREEARKTNGGEAPAVFNLSIPAMQAGDIYVMLRLLDRYGISTDNVIIDVRYGSFTPRRPDAPIVFWLKDALKQVDRESFDRVLPQLQANGYKEPEGWDRKLHAFIENRVYPKLSVFAYKDAIVHEAKAWYKQKFKGASSAYNTPIGDTRYWGDKGEALKKYVKDPQIVSSVNPEPFDMSENNPQIYFLNKIIEHQKETNTLIFLSGINDGLLKEAVENPGYVENLKKIDAYFADKPVKYVNLQGVISEKKFSDHTHFTAEGYQQLAAILWDNMRKGEGK